MSVIVFYFALLSSWSTKKAWSWWRKDRRRNVEEENEGEEPTLPKIILK